MAGMGSQVYRRTFGWLAALSVTPLLTALVLWAASYRREVAGYRQDGRTGLMVWSAAGRVRWLRWQNVGNTLPRADGWTWHSFPEDGGRATVDSLVTKLAGPASGGSLPYWQLAVMATLPPTVLVTVRRLRRRRLADRIGRGLCPACAYDLTSNVSGVCPECGTAVSDRKEARS
jgi:hypothetical protein